MGETPLDSQTKKTRGKGYELLIFTLKAMLATAIYPLYRHKSRPYWGNMHSLYCLNVENCL